jgi:hypothetical protein
MGSLEETWRAKTIEELREASAHLDEYTPEARAAIDGELERRNSGELPPKPVETPSEVENEAPTERSLPVSTRILGVLVCLLAVFTLAQPWLQQADRDVVAERLAQFDKASRRSLSPQSIEHLRKLEEGSARGEVAGRAFAEWILPGVLALLIGIKTFSGRRWAIILVGLGAAVSFIAALGFATSMLKSGDSSHLAINLIIFAGLELVILTPLFWRIIKQW